MRKIIAIFAAMLIMLQQTALAQSDLTEFPDIAAKAAMQAENEFQPSVGYEAYEKLAEYIASKYLDDSYTAEDIMMRGLSEYLGQMGDDALVPMLKGALQSMDEYSDFYTKSEFIEYNNNLNKTFYGLGVMLEQSGEYVMITGFSEENGLAEKSGFRVGDKIVKVDGISVVGNSVAEVKNLVVGEIGTTVIVTVLRDGKNVEITGTRTAVNSTTVSGGVLDNGVGYIKLASFSSNSAKEFSDVANTLKKEGVTELILDLRNNPGGLVSAAVDIAQQIILKGKIVDVKYRDSSLNHTYYSQLEKAPFDMVVLVNGNTASSSEILASAIQDSGAGILLGEQTYGKAVIQSSYMLNNGMVFKLTIGKYLTRNGKEIANVGLTPDIEVENYTKRIDTTGYTKFDFLTPTSVGASGTNVTAAKERLAIMNYYIGNLENDVFNTDLKEAVKKFQQENNLTDSGVLDIPTQIRMKEVFEKLETEVDMQMRTAYEHFGGNAEDLYGDSDED